MINPMDLIQNGDFVEVIDEEFNKKEYYLVLTDWYGKILFVKNGDQSEYSSYFKENYIISKIFRHKDGWFNLTDSLNGIFKNHMADVIYDRSNDVLELTVKDIEQKFGQRVKIVSEPIEKIVKGGMYKGFEIPDFPNERYLIIMIEEIKNYNASICCLPDKISCIKTDCKFCIYSKSRADEGNLRLEFLEKLYLQEYGE